MSKYSFVLPAYKARFFKEALDSILAQTYKDFELIIVNDASPEDLDSIVKNYDDSRIRYYVNEDNIGGKDLVAQWNHCLEYAKGDYVILASDDDVYSPLYLEKMDELVCKYSNIYVFRSRIQTIDSASLVLHQFGILAEKLSQIEYIYHWMKGNAGSGIGYFIFHKDTLINQGGFFNIPLAWGSDDITVVNMAKNGIVFSPHTLFSFRISGINITSKINDAATMRQKLLAYKIFEAWLERLVYQLDKEFNDNNIFFHYIKHNYHIFIRRLVFELLKSSSPSAIIKNLKIFFQLKCVSFLRGMYWITKVFLKRVAISV